MIKEHGFSIVEAVIATALTLAVMGTVFALVSPGQQQFAAQGEAVDMQQRLRVAAGQLYADLVRAGAGSDRTPNRGSLAYYFAPVLPYRYGTDRDDPPGTFTTDTITLMFVVPSVARTSLAGPGPYGVSGKIDVNADPGCPVNDPSCGFRDDMKIVLYDALGHYDTFRVARVQGSALDIDRTGGGLTRADYAPGATTVAQLSSIVYFLKSDPASGTFQLMSHDGGGSDVPVVDHLVALGFEYYGESRPPQLTGRPLTEPVGPWTTYGPAPPPLDQQMPGSGYPAGENCTFAVDPSIGVHIPRLANLAGGQPAALVPLDAARLTDGPWCPDPSNVNRWDADLLRIRKIAVVLRVQAANAAFRGPASLLFQHGGTATGGHRWLPDREMRFDVAPRNLELVR